MSNYRGWAPWTILYAALLALTQLGMSPLDRVNDESTFMLLAADLLNGHLPYTEIFDNKPPLIFFMLAGVMGLFGKTVLAVRLFGDVCLLVSSVMILLIARRHYSGVAAGMGGVLNVAIHSVMPGLHTSAGLPAMAFVMIALWCLITRPDRVWALALAGLLISLATLTRTNLAYLAVGAGALLAVAGWVFPRRSGVPGWAVVPFTLAGLAPPALMGLLYWQAGALTELKLATIDVALNYAGVWQWSLAGLVKYHMLVWGDKVLEVPIVYGSFTVLALAGLVALMWPRRTDETRAPGLAWYWIATWVFVLSVCLSILKSGVVFDYYWQQFFPFVGLLVAALIDRLRALPLLRAATIALVLAGMSAGLVRSGPDSLEILLHPGRLEDRHEVRRAAEAITGAMREGDQVWAVRAPLILFYLDLPLISPVVAHPANIGTERIMEPLVAAGYVPEGELDRLFDRRPEFLVTDQHVFIYYFDDAEQARLEKMLATDYHRFLEGPEFIVFRRNDHPSVKDIQPMDPVPAE